VQRLLCTSIGDEADDAAIKAAVEFLEGEWDDEKVQVLILRLERAALKGNAEAQYYLGAIHYFRFKMPAEDGPTEETIQVTAPVSREDVMREIDLMKKYAKFKARHKRKVLAGKASPADAPKPPESTQSPKEKSLAEAIHWLRLAAKMNDAHAMQLLGDTLLGMETVDEKKEGTLHTA
jgi:TPR repeat protein